ncbi:MAG: GAF domain-containing protein [Flavobacteriales bacterium]
MKKDKVMGNTLKAEHFSDELPLQLQLSFKGLIDGFRKYTSEVYKDHPFHLASINFIEEIKDYPELEEGFNDISKLEQYKHLIDIILEPIFPEPLMSNEIKAACIPFSFHAFKFTDRLKGIIDNAGEDYEFLTRGFNTNYIYIQSCAFILGKLYGYPIDLQRPFYFDIPDKKNGVLKHYRVAFNADFGEVEPTDLAPEITEEDYHLLLDSFDDIEVWKEKFPPNSYIFKGFGLLNLFDVTADETISSIQKNLLSGKRNGFTELQEELANFYGIKDIQIGFSLFNLPDKNADEDFELLKADSLIFDLEEIDECNNTCENLLCDDIVNNIFIKQQAYAISDVEAYGKRNDFNELYKKIKSNGIESIILIPIKPKNHNDLAILEIASPKKYELNSINQSKMIDILEIFELAIDRFSNEFKNIVEATIQEHYTAIHPTVKWKFYDAVKNNLRSKDATYEIENTQKLNEIVFKDVYPLFGQSDIKGSSIARNNAIRDDLSKQLNLAIDVLQSASLDLKLPIYKEHQYRVEQYLGKVLVGLNAGDEIGILDFLKKDIYPVFSHLKNINSKLADLVGVYMSQIDPELHVVYEKRRDYEHSVSLLNEKLANFIDEQQEDAQNMFPHYFERYKTDGVEYNMYIGQSLVKNKKFDDVYLYNLRLWQLQLMCDMENVANVARKEMDADLQVASLILVHSNPLAIKFRMDEKKFDVDGAYNIRYEIIKKRIDKAHIKGTQDRLTIPGKIAIVYSQDKDAKEYKKYISYLQSKNRLGKVEDLDIEDLQGVSGLKALRVEVIYQKNFDEKQALTLKELVNEVEI